MEPIPPRSIFKDPSRYLTPQYHFSVSDAEENGPERDNEKLTMTWMEIIQCSLIIVIDYSSLMMHGISQVINLVGFRHEKDDEVFVLT